MLNFVAYNTYQPLIHTTFPVEADTKSFKNKEKQKRDKENGKREVERDKERKKQTGRD